jgi:hypothetical protein
VETPSQGYPLNSLLRSHDANLVVGDLDTLRQRAQVVAAVAAPFEPDALAGAHGRTPRAWSG